MSDSEDSEELDKETIGKRVSEKLPKKFGKIKKQILIEKHKNRWLRLWIQRNCKSIETYSHFLTGQGLMAQSIRA